MRDQFVDVDLLVHVPVDDPRHVGAAAGAAERRTLPHPPGDQLERPGLDLLPRSGDADDDRHAPATVAALERLAHEIDVADALEAVVGAAVGQTHQVLHQIPADFLGVHEVRHPEAFRKRLAARIDIHADDLVRADQARALDDVQPNAAQAKHHHVRAGLDLGGIDDRPDAGRDAAADVTDLLEGRVLADFGERNLRQHRVIGKSRASHVVIHHLLAHREAAGAVRHDALALGGADGRAQVGLARQARLALPALGRVERNHVIALFDRGDAGPHVHDDASALVPENHREQTLRIGARPGEFVRVTHAARVDLHQYFAGLRAVQIDGNHFQRLSGSMRNGSLSLHASSPLIGVQARHHKSTRLCVKFQKRLVRMQPRWATMRLEANIGVRLAMADTVFGKIVRGEIPCHKVYEDARVLAFLDINPLSPGHTLVVPKEPAETLDRLSDESAAALGRVLPRLCRAVVAVTGIKEYNVLENNGTGAHQAIAHVHFHIIPKPNGREGLGIGWPLTTLDPKAGAALAAKIAGALS